MLLKKIKPLNHHVKAKAKVLSYIFLELHKEIFLLTFFQYEVKNELGQEKKLEKKKKVVLFAHVRCN